MDNRATAGPPGHLIRRLHQIATGLFNEALQDHDITSVQSAALLVVVSHPGMDITTLARRIACDRSTIGPVVDRLLAKGLIVRQESPNDRRKKLLHPTDAGRALLEEIRPLVRRSQNRFVEALSEAEQARFFALATRIIEHHGDKEAEPAGMAQVAARARPPQETKA